MTTKRNKYTFILNDFDYRKIIDEFFYLKNNVNEKEIVLSNNNQEEISNNIMYGNTQLSSSKSNEIKKHVTMVDFSKMNGVMPSATDKNCWWCRNKFSNQPIGIPIMYYPDTNAFELGASSNGVLIQKYFEKENIILNENDFFDVEGIFCSFPCCKAYIKEHQFNSKYKYSQSNLTLLYAKLYEELDLDIPCAPSWKILEDYGGTLTIEQFRDSVDKKYYNLTTNIKRPYMFITGIYFEEQPKLNNYKI